MRLGVNVPNFGPGTNPEVLRAWARTVEGLGFDLLMVSDHVVITDDVKAFYPAPFYEPFTTLSWLAGVTERITLGTTVLVLPLRHPLLVARMAANLDRLSGGRFVLGVGAGWARQEHDALGVPHDRRGRLTDEALVTIKDAWRDHDDYRAGHIPIWVGGDSAPALRRAVAHGDAWHPLRQTPEQFEEALARLKTAAQDAGKPVPALAPRILLNLTDDPPAERRLGEGTVAQVVADLHRLRDLGAGTVVLDPYLGDPRETLEPEAAWHALAAVRKEFR
ncbi:LLM class flavin-dependent oxidoreductase [Saccharothrix violaceirubra]|uniref:Alkanesulfonate monooxygenase SsuD/methylene tetrahydromethanopterin reductase-like flavin-dependent oxidoreductase (Luciferase family) n=1 Tax=Saccharothrix violaceirubra TaxID=413306 RepID=A0A7W7SYN5_9PSEU|nr:LLM class flavin-dependent oxidoreductase [Saccharothrix violaceirubra]MBB4963366.1 alkanesulfonate monooxygenase SsuD/methylene tetrahydromethanopterin reductase-like flavin-dependent oxidoreductase (luciferase family) [Saccharothrix violaceirubra]